MSEPEVHELITPVVPGLGDEMLAAIMDRTRGNPLFVSQVARLLAQESPETA